MPIYFNVLSPDLLERLDEFVSVMENSGADELLLQNYIRVSKEEADEYKKWMNDCFDIVSVLDKYWYA